MDRNAKIDELLAVFLQFKRQVRKQVTAHTHDGLTMAQSELLFRVHNGCTRLSDIAISQNITPSAATQQVRLLEAEGLIKRTRSSDDKREQQLAITAKGRKLLAKQREQLHAKLRSYVEPLDDADIDAFIRIMNKMIAGQHQPK